MKGLKGSILCNRCGVAMKEGVCPKCGRPQCHVCLYWKGDVLKRYDDSHGVTLSQMAAVHILQEINREIKAKIFTPDKWFGATRQNRNFSKAIDLWINDCKEQVKRGEMSVSVPVLYQSMAKKHFLNDIYGFTKHQVDEVGVFEIKQFARSLPEKLKITSRRAIVRNLHIFFNWLWKEGMINEIPAFPTIKGNNSRPRVALTSEDQEKAFSRIPEAHRDLFIFEAKTGLRPGETCALKIRDIDFKNKTMTVRSTFTVNRFRDADKENHKAPIPLSETALEIAKKRAAGRFPDDWLFLNSKGRHYTQANLADIWDDYSKTGLTHYEGTRHSYASFVAKNIDSKAAQKLLRHKSASSTERYVHMEVEYLRDKLNELDNVVEMKRQEKK